MVAGGGEQRLRRAIDERIDDRSAHGLGIGRDGDAPAVELLGEQRDAGERRVGVPGVLHAEDVRGVGRRHSGDDEPDRVRPAIRGRRPPLAIRAGGRAAPGRSPDDRGAPDSRRLGRLASRAARPGAPTRSANRPTSPPRRGPARCRSRVSATRSGCSVASSESGTSRRGTDQQPLTGVSAASRVPLSHPGHPRGGERRPQPGVSAVFSGPPSRLGVGSGFPSHLPVASEPPPRRSVGSGFPLHRSVASEPRPHLPVGSGFPLRRSVASGPPPHFAVAPEPDGAHPHRFHHRAKPTHGGAVGVDPGPAVDEQRVVGRRAPDVGDERVPFAGQVGCADQAGGGAGEDRLHRLQSRDLRPDQRPVAAHHHHRGGDTQCVERAFRRFQQALNDRHQPGVEHAGHRAARTRRAGSTARGRTSPAARSVRAGGRGPRSRAPGCAPRTCRPPRTRREGFQDRRSRGPAPGGPRPRTRGPPRRDRRRSGCRGRHAAHRRCRPSPRRPRRSP